VFDVDEEDEPNALVVYALDPGGPADQAGIDRDGLIAYVGDDRVRDLADWCAATQDATVIDVGYANENNDRIRVATLNAY
jgi:C-terminal processing protease CtpA/Prc